MHIDSAEGIKIEDAIKEKCHKCDAIVAVYNDRGHLFIKKSPVAYISIYENFFEIKCKNCGAMNKVTTFPSVCIEK